MTALPTVQSRPCILVGTVVGTREGRLARLSVRDASEQEQSTKLPTAFPSCFAPLQRAPGKRAGRTSHVPASGAVATQSMLIMVTPPSQLKICRRHCGAGAKLSHHLIANIH